MSAYLSDLWAVITFQDAVHWLERMAWFLALAVGLVALGWVARELAREVRALPPVRAVRLRVPRRVSRRQLDRVVLAFTPKGGR